ncbi:CobIyrinic acid a,c-diamide adenosyltransferase, mitochondrial [Hondaea fermentalgiana]|uniref:Corrinoid adenosyltransferase MMAB n=1 Tax=Hondaea fermentalgiana TaxID=2315210 RepID=A0A2R5GT65_9STRA|nr:CobIyrinic acid a,c-diamide adenosyltransferase, mitochondrial [Hondaea fermentalgiana]|eukprot:GBG34056.1 CobIyrinic acid a,c-diamide adenosyltransferase, mitochondrial [Hondaea fermentalgiana]
MKVYTKTGDKGTSQLFNGERRSKDDAVFQALGAVDECNAFIGLACEFVDEKNADVAEQLGNIMSRMFDVGASVATPQESSSAAKLKRSSFNVVHVETLEKAIDAMDAELPPLKTFILPSGGKCAAHLHVARTLARRAERHIVPLVREGHVDANVGKFVNRLSDYLFMAARYMAMKQGHQERAWEKFVEPEAAAKSE